MLCGQTERSFRCRRLQSNLPGDWRARGGRRPTSCPDVLGTVKLRGPEVPPCECSGPGLAGWGALGAQDPGDGGHGAGAGRSKGRPRGRGWGWARAPLEGARDSPGGGAWSPASQSLPRRFHGPVGGRSVEPCVTMPRRNPPPRGSSPTGPARPLGALGFPRVWEVLAAGGRSPLLGLRRTSLGCKQLALGDGSVHGAPAPLYMCDTDDGQTAQ